MTMPRRQPSLEWRRARERLAKEEAGRSYTIIQNLLSDGGHEFDCVVLGLYRSLTPSQRELMLVDL